MRENQTQALTWFGISEGGYVDHPKDPGGATNMGITQNTYTAWLRSVGRPYKDVRHITREEVDTILATQYLAPIWFDKLPAGLDYAVGDFAVNSGSSRAVKTLQRALNDHKFPVVVDGVMGLNTMHAVERATKHIPSIITNICERRMKFLRGLRIFDTFGKGWTRRVMGNAPGAQDWDIGVIDRALRMARNEVGIPVPLPAPGKATGRQDIPALPAANIFEAIIRLILDLLASIGGRHA